MESQSRVGQKPLQSCTQLALSFLYSFTMGELAAFPFFHPF